MIKKNNFKIFELQVCFKKKSESSELDCVSVTSNKTDLLKLFNI
jgi:hypothetical protein